MLLIALFILSSCKRDDLENSLMDSQKRWLYVNTEKFPKNSKVDLYNKFYVDGKYETHILSNDKKL